MHNDFTLFKRKVPSGQTVVYYYAYDIEGKRLVGSQQRKCEAYSGGGKPPPLVPPYGPPPPPSTGF
jgi:hypothetical protein